jgi:hypothetical protein
MEKINIAELLKDCPNGMELDCTMFDGVYFDHVDDLRHNSIKCYVNNGNEHFGIALDEHGQYISNKSAKCVIFPKGKTSWEGFHRPYINGDIVYTIGDSIAILGDRIGEHSVGFRSYCGLFNYEFDTDVVVSPERFATEEEKAELFDAIKANGYKWNTETKTLEKLVEPKFKVGDKIKSKENHNYIYTITGIREKENKYECGVTFVLRFTEQDNWELVPNKFDITTLKPFDSRVLVRHNRNNKWCASFFSHIDEDFHSHCYKFVTTSGKSYPYCIPYEGNEHLLAKVDDCDEFYRNL